MLTGKLATSHAFYIARIYVTAVVVALVAYLVQCCCVSAVVVDAA
jgi:hypothetical protein